MEKAPILITTLFRINYLKKLISSLKKCVESVDTDVFIYVDYPSKPEHLKGYSEILVFLPSIDGFKSLTIKLRESNFGAEKNMLDAKEELFCTYSNLIILEDDNQVSESFLEYLNSGISIIKSNRSIFSICAYGFEGLSKFGELVLMTNFSGWGYLISRDSWNEFLKFDVVKLLDAINSISLIKLILLNIHMKKCILSVLNGSNAGDTRILVYLFIYNKFCVFPTTSLVRNYGHDGTGVHSINSKENDKFKNQFILNNSFNLHGHIDSNIKVVSDSYEVLKFNLFYRIYYFLLFLIRIVRIKIRIL